MIHRQLLSVLGEKVPFSLDEMLAEIGLETTKCQDLYSKCMKFDLSYKGSNDFECCLCDLEMQIPITTATFDRPVQETVHIKPLDQRGTIALMGKGWTRELCLSWFGHKASKTKEEEVDSVVATQDSSAIKQKKQSHRINHLQ